MFDFISLPPHLFSLCFFVSFPLQFFPSILRCKPALLDIRRGIVTPIQLLLFFNPSTICLPFLSFPFPYLYYCQITCPMQTYWLSGRKWASGRMEGVTQIHRCAVFLPSVSSVMSSETFCLCFGQYQAHPQNSLISGGLGT